jgi:hypothetical protein
VLDRGHEGQSTRWCDIAKCPCLGPVNPEGPSCYTGRSGRISSDSSSSSSRA